MTYEGLYTKMRQLSQFFIDQGVRKGDRIAIYTNRCLESVIAVYGIMECGAVFVPLDITAPPSRTSYLLQACGISHMVTIPSLKRKISTLLGSGSSLLSVIGAEADATVPSFSWDYIYALSLKNYSPVNVLEQDLAYIMYTSGSTGDPKGIMHTHYSGLSYARLSAELYGVSPRDVVANHAPLHFDIATFGYFTAPFSGATTVLVSDAQTILPQSLAALISKEGITIWYSVPLALIQLISSGSLQKYTIDTLRWVLFGGEKFAVKYLNHLMQLWPSARFCNVYGPAEINQCTYFHIPNLLEEDATIPIGQVWGNSEYKILDAKDNEVSGSEPGELVVRTATMMQGYWGNPVLTEKSLFKVKRDDGLSNSFYRTGDLVKKDSNGDLIFLGRNDFQVKVRGYRVELGEIESVIRVFGGIKEAIAFSHIDEYGESQIWAKIVTEDDSQPEINKLMEFCKSRLPGYAMPQNIEVMEDFPRTSSGKINRMELLKSYLKV